MRLASTARAYDHVYLSSGASESEEAAASRASTSTAPHSSRPFPMVAYFSEQYPLLNGKSTSNTGSRNVSTLFFDLGPTIIGKNFVTAGYHWVNTPLGKPTETFAICGLSA